MSLLSDEIKNLEVGDKRITKRMSGHSTVLCVQDTSEMDYTGKNHIQGLGIIDSWNWSRETGSLGKDKVASRPVMQQIYSQRVTLKGVYRKQGRLQDVDITIITRRV